VWIIERDALGCVQSDVERVIERDAATITAILETPRTSRGPWRCAADEADLAADDPAWNGPGIHRAHGSDRPVRFREQALNAPLKTPLNAL